jgi:hypothetical protein
MTPKTELWQQLSQTSASIIDYNEISEIIESSDYQKNSIAYDERDRLKWKHMMDLKYPK